MHDLVRKIMLKGSPKSGQRDKQALVKGLEMISPMKRKEVVLHISRQIHEQNEITSNIAAESEAMQASKKGSAKNLLSMPTTSFKYKNQDDVEGGGGPKKGSQDRLATVSKQLLEAFAETVSAETANHKMQKSATGNLHRAASTGGKSMFSGANIGGRPKSVINQRNDHHGSVSEKLNKFHLWRQTFFDKLLCPNDNRFVPFNDMPKNCSKYKNIDHGFSFDKQVTRSTSIAGGGIDAKKDAFLQDYDADHEILKRPLSRGGKL